MFSLELLVMLGLGEFFFETTFSHNKIFRTNFLTIYAIEHIDVQICVRDFKCFCHFIPEICNFEFIPKIVFFCF
jgi:hypothetical protein